MSARTYPLTVAMTPSFIFDGDWLLRAQLKCLSEQTFKDFDVWLIDAHYSKRHGYMQELREKYNLDIVHVPYSPNLSVAKKLDCSIFNAPYVYSESPKIVRYSCWRFVRPNFTGTCVNSNMSVDFYFHNVEPPTRDSMHIVTNHDARIWDMKSDVVNWDLIPKKSGQPGASWGSDSDRVAKPTVFPLNCYGNYMVPREEWFRINGCDEAIFSSEHWEDQDFCNRINRAGVPCWRMPHVMYRLHHLYGGHSGRSNRQPDWGEFMEPCPKCQAVEHNPKPDRRDLKRRMAAGEVMTFGHGRTWVCRNCYYCGPVFHADEGEYLQSLAKHGYTRSNILPMVKLGRNLQALADDMDGKSLGAKVEIFNDSWSNPKYYQP
jgi:hypothetical protein